jgi:hypothetical protein
LHRFNRIGNIVVVLFISIHKERVIVALFENGFIEEVILGRFIIECQRFGSSGELIFEGVRFFAEIVGNISVYYLLNAESRR